MDLTAQAADYCRKPNTQYGASGHRSPVMEPMLTNDTGFGSLSWVRNAWTSTTFDSCKNYVFTGDAKINGNELTTLNFAMCVEP